MTDRVNHAMFVSDAARPFPLMVTLQGLWFSNACKRMLLNIVKQSCNALHDSHIACLLPVFMVFPCLLQQNYFHKSSMAMGFRFPLAISSSPSRRILSSSADDMRFSSASLAIFMVARRFRDFTAFFIKPSSPEITWRAPKRSEFNCNCIAVIVVSFLLLQNYTFFFY